MADVPDGLGERLERTLSANLDRGTLLREMEQLAREPGFSAFADLWAPGLYRRDAAFFEPFLLRRLDGSREKAIRDLLPLAEAAGQDTLFSGLYRKVANEDAWNTELLALARSAQPDEQVLRAVQRREMSRGWFTLREEVALALYRRSPERFATFVYQHVRRVWWRGQRSETFQRLRAEAQQRADDELFWALFRELAEPGEWERSVTQLLHDNIPASAVVEELRKRHPTHLREANTGILGDFVERYGQAVLPYIEENLSWVARRSGDRLLAAAKKLGDEDLYWRMFFNVGDHTKWNAALRELLKRPLSDTALLREVQRRTPPQRWSWWVEKDVALQFYRRNPDMFRPFLERFLYKYEPDEMLFQEAERARDEELLDFLSFLSLPQLARAIRWAPGSSVREQAERLGKMLKDRFDRLYAESPETYVQHAANILGRFEPEPPEFWSFQQNVEYNPAFAYLFRQHRNAWRKSASGIRELLESPNIYIQIIALDMLGSGGSDAAERVVENLVLLRALLLGRARRSTKKQVLRCLEQAARQDAASAAQVLPLLEETLYFRGKRAIDERLMVAFVRLRHAQAAQPSA